MEKTTVAEIAANARRAATILAGLSAKVRNKAIVNMAEILAANKEQVLAVNELDRKQAEADGNCGPLLERLRLSEKMYRYMIERLRKAAKLPDPLGIITRGHIRPSGLKVQRISVALGVVAVIYESRPNVTTDAAAVCIKSGNCVLLRGGSECLKTNLLLADLMAKAAEDAGIPQAAIQIIRTANRSAVGELLQQSKYIDVLIPRGGRSLIERITAESRIPVIKHYDGICHQYVAADAPADMAVAVVLNSKCEKVEVCNALETLLIDSACSKDLLPLIARSLESNGVKLLGCDKCRAIYSMEAASEDDWSTEYLAPVLSIKIVDGIRAAIEHINTYGSGHTDGIITSSLALSQRFVAEVDSASVMINASTRLSGGGDYGMGAVIGISTDKLHARGPVGPEELTTHKWIAEGNGHLRG